MFALDIFVVDKFAAVDLFEVDVYAVDISAVENFAVDIFAVDIFATEILFAIAELVAGKIKLQHCTGLCRFPWMLSTAIYFALSFSYSVVTFTTYQ